MKSSTLELTIEILLERDSGVINSNSFMEFLRFIEGISHLEDHFNDYCLWTFIECTYEIGG